MITLVLKSCTCDGRLLFGWQWRNGSEMKCSNQTQIPPSVHSISSMELLGSRITLCIVSLRIHDHYICHHHCSSCCHAVPCFYAIIIAVPAMLLV